MPNQIQTTKNQADRPIVSIVCGNVYPIFDNSTHAIYGGMETQAALIGRSLAANGWLRIHYVVSDFGQPFKTALEGINFLIYQSAYRRAGRNIFPRLRQRRLFPELYFDRRDLDLLWQIPLITAWLALPAIFFPRFWRLLKPDAVFCFGNNERSAEVIADCFRLGIPTLLYIASDKDISPDYRHGNHEPNHYGMPKWKGYYALSTADGIIVQSEAQSRALMRYFGRSSTLIRNPVYVSPNDRKQWLPRETREYVLWIGRTDDFNKRPMLFLELAKDCPEISFLMLVGLTSEISFHALKHACPANLRIVEQVPQPEVLEYLSRARVLVNTSKFEGFPNTFLEAAVMGVPVVSLSVDPDGMLSQLGCGICAGGDTAVLRNSVKRLFQDNGEAERYATASHAYTLERHGAAGRIEEFEACLRKLMERTTQPVRLPWWTLIQRFARRRVRKNEPGKNNG